MTRTASPQTTTAEARPSRDRRLLRGYLHKTSNSLCGIKGYASLIAAPQLESAAAARWARKIITEVEKMEEIFRSVGDLTAPRGHPDAGVDLPRLLADVVSLCERKCPGLRVLTGRIPHGELRLPRVDLGLVLTELLCNAHEGRDGRPRPVRVELTAEVRPTGRLAVTVRDDGPGIAPEVLPQVTAPFLTTKDGHVGVGLTRVETLLDMYGLAWDLRSEPGAGTTVTLEVAESLTETPHADVPRGGPVAEVPCET
jgi:two-component system C4-dicarboxylate transport sensor histidine kinase DctB